jgi:hypothetical protein
LCSGSRLGSIAHEPVIYEPPITFRFLESGIPDQFLTYARVPCNAAVPPTINQRYLSRRNGVSKSSRLPGESSAWQCLLDAPPAPCAGIRRQVFRETSRIALHQRPIPCVKGTPTPTHRHPVHNRVRNGLPIPSLGGGWPDCRAVIVRSVYQRLQKPSFEPFGIQL